MIVKLGNYLCHAIKIGGCEQGHIVNTIGYAAVILPVVIASLLFMHRNHH
jgi:hypothetical protein